MDKRTTTKNGLEVIMNYVLCGGLPIDNVLTEKEWNFITVLLIRGAENGYKATDYTDLYKYKRD